MPRNRTADWAVFVLQLLLRWPGEAVRAAAWWALAVLVAEQVSPRAVIADPWARLRWVLVAGAITAGLGPIPFRGPARVSASDRSSDAA